MSVRRIKAGTTDVSVVLRIVDSTDGTPETGVVFNTAGIDLWYRRELAASVDITEATLAALTTAHSDGGFLHINDGWYRLDLPDAACATGVSGVQIGGTVTGMVVLGPYIELPVNTEEDVYTRIGAPAGASVSADIAAIEAQTDDIGAAGAGLTAVPWNAAWDAEVESEVDDALGGGTGTALTAIPWNASWDAEVQSEVEDGLVAHRLDELLNADSDIDGAAPPTVGSVFHELLTKTAGSFTYDQTTDSLEAIRDKETDIETDTAEIGAAGAGLTNINLPNQTMDIVGNITGNLSGSVGSVTGAVGSVAGNVDGSVGSVAAGGIANTSFAAGAIDNAALAADAIGASEFAASAVDEILDDPLTDSVPADGALPTVRQALYMLTQFMCERSVSGTTVTVKKVDGTTALMTFTLDDGTTPTSITRAT